MKNTDDLTSNIALPLISIIIPVFNGAACLEYAIRSVIDQDYKNIELIIVDGNSDDGTIEIIKKYENRITHWISEPDRGVYDAMNKGIQLCHGDWIYFMGADDILLNILCQISNSLENKKEIYYGDVYMTSYHKIYAGEFDAKKLSKRNIPHQAIFYPRSVFDSYLYDTKYEVFADYHLNIRCFGNKDFNFVYLKVLVAIFNDCGKSSKVKDVLFFNDFIDILKNNLGNDLGSVYLLWKKLRKIKKDCKEMVRNYLRSKLHEKQ